MKSFREMRKEAWKTATTRWSFRLLFALWFFIFLAGLIFGPLAEFYDENSIQTWGDFTKSQAEFMKSGLQLAVPSAHQFWSMTWASSLEGFLQMVFQGLFIFGLISVALRAVRREDKGWIGSVFGGFKAPLELTWLNLLMCIRIMLWMLLFVIPGIVAAFRYAMAWYVKSDHPEYSAWKCLAESGRLMKGHKWGLFFYGLSYMGWFIFVGIVILTANHLVADLPILSLGMSAIGVALMMFTVAYMVFGQAVYYTELKKISKNENTEGSNADASAESTES